MLMMISVLELTYFFSPISAHIAHSTIVSFLGEKKRPAFLDLLIESAENGVVLTDKEVREQVDTIMFEVIKPSSKAFSR